MQCLNCGFDTDGNFCSNCGQKTTVEKLQLKKVISGFFSSILNFDKGVFQNIIGLSLRPRKTVLAYLDGRRKQYLNPISYAFVMLTLLVIVNDKFADTTLMQPLSESARSNQPKYSIFEVGKQFGYILSHYFKFLWLLLIPLFAFWHWIFSPKRTFAEHFATNAFIIGHTALITICAFPFYNPPLYINMVLFISIFIFSTLIYFNPKKKSNIFFHLFGILVGFLSFYILPALFIFLYYLLLAR